MKPYYHKIQYYETDQMGVVHHSNYIRWFEEARVEFLEQVGFGYDKMENTGIVAPVLGVRATYKKMTRFAETVQITVEVVRFTGIKFTLSYEIKNTAGEICCTGETDHCFLDKEGRPLRLKDRFPEIYRIMQRASKTEE